MMLIIAFGDMTVAFCIGARYGPARARTLTIEGMRDPRLGQDIRPLWGIPSIQDVKETIREELATAREGSSGFEELKRLLTEGASKEWQAELKAALADVRRQADRLSSKLDHPPALSVSPEVEDRIVRTIRTKVSQVLEEQMARIGVQAGGVGGMGGTPNAQQNPEAYVAYITQQQNQDVWAAALIERGYPEGMSRAIARGGEMAIKVFAQSNGMDPREILS